MNSKSKEPKQPATLSPLGPDSVLPFERRSNESAKAYAAFVVFRDLGANRSVLKAYRQKTGKKEARQPPGLWNGWAAAHEWHARARAWDRHLDEKSRAAQEQARKDMAGRHATAAVALQAKALSRLKELNPEELTASEVLRYLIEAAKLERLARGEPEAVLTQEVNLTANITHTERREAIAFMRDLLTPFPEAREAISEEIRKRLEAQRSDADAGTQASQP